jgi:nucleoside-diphosphate-sugar epimerase
MPHAFIIGGTGQIGLATAEHLLNEGWTVTLGHRGSHTIPTGLVERGVQAALFDREQTGSLASALHKGADLLVDAVAYGPEHGRQLLEVQSSVGAAVVISSSSVYRDEAGRTLDEAAETGFPDFLSPLTEQQITVNPGPETYSTRKVALERLLLDEATAPVTIMRPAAISGPLSGHAREWWFVKRILDGRPFIPLAYSGSSRFHPTSAANIAELVRVVAGLSGQRVLNIADPTAPSIFEIASLIAGIFGYKGRLIPLESVDAYPPPIVGRTPWSVQHPFVLDTTAAASLGYRARVTYRETAGAICQWLAHTANDKNWRELLPVLASYPFDLFDYVSEDAILARISVLRPTAPEP